MTVCELIEILGRMNPNAAVFLESSDGERNGLYDVARGAYDDMGDVYPIDDQRPREDAVILSVLSG
jgi:hypothetical protein